jgi:hypothetical protein
MKATWDVEQRCASGEGNERSKLVQDDVRPSLLQVYLKKIGLLRPYLTTWTSQVIRVKRGSCYSTCILVGNIPGSLSK